MFRRMDARRAGAVQKACADAARASVLRHPIGDCLVGAVPTECQARVPQRLLAAVLDDARAFGASSEKEGSGCRGRRSTWVR